MKKTIILSCILLLGAAANAAGVDFALPPSVGGLQNTDFQMRLMDQQRFRQEEYDEYKDMQQQKEERNQKINLQQKFEQQQKATTPTYTPDVNLIRENGELKLKSITAD